MPVQHAPPCSCPHSMTAEGITRMSLPASCSIPLSFHPARRQHDGPCAQVIMLLLGGFAIAGALSKHNIAKTLASSVLSRVGQGPGLVLLANMLMATFVSMWIRYAVQRWLRV